MRHASPRDVEQDKAPSSSTGRATRRRLPPTRERLGRLRAVSDRVVESTEYDEETQGAFVEVMGPELLEVAFDELGDLALVRGELSDSLRLHVSALQRLDEEDLW